VMKFETLNEKKLEIKFTFTVMMDDSGLNSSVSTLVMDLLV